MQGNEPAGGEVIQCEVSPPFHAWLSRTDGSLAITTYQAGKVALLGWDGRQPSLLLRHFDKPLGLAVDAERMALATRHDIVLFANAPPLAYSYLESHPGRYDALYLPRVSYHTGDLNVHDLAFGENALWLVNTRFSCLAGLSEEFNFVPRWKPPFVSDVVPEDRCHLNGLAMVNRRPKFVTALGETDAVGGWRANKASGGVLIDVETNEVVLRSLSMPHSPRWHDGKLWLLNSGAGELIVFDPARQQADVVCALPGYLRGLCFVGKHAVVGLCQIRELHIFGGLPVQERFAQLKCAIAAIDLRTGAVEAMLEFTAGCQELYDVQFLPGVRLPNILNLERYAARQAFTAPGFSYWLRPSAEIPPVDPPL